MSEDPAIRLPARAGAGLPLRLRGVRKAYAGRRVLDGIDLDVAAGEAVAILGANGAGKSTLLRIAATQARPDAGQVEVAGRDALREPALARRHLAYLGQDPAVYAELTPAEHLRLWARLRRVSVDPDALLARAGLAAVAHRPAGALSRGQRQRLALAIALDVGPADGVRPFLVVLDEPGTALDAAGAADLDRRIAALRANGHGVLLALHDEAHAARVADRVVRLEHHRIGPSGAAPAIVAGAAEATP